MNKYIAMCALLIAAIAQGSQQDPATAWKNSALKAYCAMLYEKQQEQIHEAFNDLTTKRNTDGIVAPTTIKAHNLYHTLCIAARRITDAQKAQTQQPVDSCMPIKASNPPTRNDSAITQSTPVYDIPTPTIRSPVYPPNNNLWKH